MSNSKIETAKGLCVIALTKFLMRKYGVKQDKAYAMLLKMDLYQLLMDDDTRLFLETNDYPSQCCELEIEQGKNSMYEFINQDLQVV